MATILLFNKPYQVLSQFTDKLDRATLADFIPNGGLYPAGRLDYDSEGLLLLTDDGKLQHQISHPKHKQTKTYWVQVEGPPSNAALQALRTGIILKDGITKPAKAQLMKEPKLWERHPPIRHRNNIPTHWLEISIREGRNRQIRRMTAALGLPTLRLIRVRIGPWALGGLPTGEYRQETVHSEHYHQQMNPRQKRKSK